MISAQNSRPFLAALLGCAVLLPFGPALAVEDISGEAWEYFVPPDRPSTGPVHFVFDAKITPMDRLYGLRFKLVARDPRGQPQTLVDWYYVGVRDLPAAGSAVHFDLTLTLDCLRGGSLVGDADGWIMWETGGKKVRAPISPSRTPAVATSGRFGLALVDEYGVPGPHPMQEEALSCRDERLHPSIGLYFDPLGTVCQGTIRPGTPGKIYVVAKLNGVLAGAAGAEFRFTGIPASWTTYPVAHPEALALGDPFGDGVSMGFTCQRPPSGILQLYEVVVLAAAEESDLEFGIGSKKYRDYSGFCPFVVACNDPVFTKVCVETKPCFVNATVPKPCGGPVALVERTWSQLKAIYR